MMNNKSLPKHLFILLLVSAGVISVDAQPLYYKVLGSFERIAFGESEWVDLDNDNDLDLIMFGDNKDYVPLTIVYENNSGNFTARTTGIVGIHYGSIAVGDYDKDGDKDILLSGGTSINNDNTSVVYRNDGGFVFTPQHILQGLSSTSAEWFDLDNDEDLDIVMSGSPNNSYNYFKTVVYENTGSTFVEVSGTQLPDCIYCGVDVGDGNGDGKIDILISGFYEASLYLNKGDKTFIKDANAPLKLLGGAIKWGDFDTDGDLDILQAGSDQSNQYHSVIHENKVGSFVERTDIPLIGFAGNSRGMGVLWFDYNMNGKLDLLLTGPTAGFGTTNRVYQNNGGGSFGEIQEPEFDPLIDMALDDGDFDNDGDMDLSFEGYLASLMGIGSTPLAGYFRNGLYNGSPVSNTKPLPPSSATFKEKIYRREIRLSWDAGSDAQTPADGLRYNFYLRDATKKIIVPSVNFTTGALYTANVPNASSRKGFANNVPEGTLFYAVQAIDGAKTGSVFSSEKSFFHFNGPECVKAEIIDDDNVKLTWLDHSTIETNYRIARSTSPLSGFAQLANRPANTVTYTDNFNFLTETLYYYRVNAYNASNTSSYDSLVLVMPERVSGTAAQSINASTINLTWQDHSQYETGFQIERKKSTESVFVAVATVGANVLFYADAGLEQGTTYQYRVRSISANGGLTPLSFVSAKTNYYSIGVDFAVYGTEDSDLLLTSQNFESHFTDNDVADDLIQIKMVGLPGNGSLLLNNIAVVAGQEIPSSSLNQLVFKPETDFNGTSPFFILVSDGKDYSQSQTTVTLNVASVNDPPKFELMESKTVEEDSYNFEIWPQIEYVPYESEVIEFSLSPLTSNLVNIQFEKTNGVILFSSVKDKFGEVEFTLTANDGQASVSKKFKLIITPVNDTPELGDISNVTTMRGEAIDPIRLNVSDVDNQVSTLVFSAYSYRPEVIRETKVTFNVNANGEVDMKLVPEGVIGLTTVVIFVSDGIVRTSKAFLLTVTPNTVTAIEQLETNQVRIFPNVFNDKLTVAIERSSGEFDVALLDMLGRNIMSASTSSGLATFDTRSMLSGVYIVNIKGKNGKSFQARVVKE